MGRPRLRGAARRRGVVCLALLALALAGCPAEKRVTVDFVGAPRTGPPGTAVVFVGQADALPPYVLSTKFRGLDDVGTAVEIRDWAWAFGDGATGRGQSVTHVYTAAGVYDVTLTVTYADVGAKSTGETVSLERPGYIVITDPNLPPVADAGLDGGVYWNRPITVDGSGSSDPDGDPLTFAWALVSAPDGSTATTADLSGADRAAATLMPDAAGDYTFVLTVSDGSLTDEDTVTMRVAANRRPVASLPTYQEPVHVGVEMMVQGGGYDLDGDPITYAFTLLSVPEGSTARLSDTTVARPTLPLDRVGEYVVQLVVSDPWESSEPATTVVTAANGLPVADAGPDQAVVVGMAAVLDGTGSHDPDGDPFTYAWVLAERPAGSAAALDNPASPRPSFTADLPGRYTAQLVVSDAWDASTPDTVTVTTVNRAPVADAGPDQARAIGQRAVLDGSASSDPDGDALSYAWTLTSVPQGSAAALTNADTAAPWFTADLPGDYVTALVVSDGALASAPDTVTVRVENRAPVADAGPDQTRRVTETATLDGSGSIDLDGDALVFAWTLTRVPDGSGAVLAKADTARPSFTVDVPGDYTAQLTVSDGRLESAPDTVTVSTVNSPPTADAGPDQTRYVNETVTLNGSGSSDVDGDALSFAWSLTERPEGSTAALNDPAAVSPTFVIDVPGDYAARLVVNDGTVDSAPDTARISTRNSPPVSDAGPDQTRYVTDMAVLDGGGSSDADGDALTYWWSFVSRPAGSTAALDDRAAVSPAFVVDAPGEYVVQLVVSDGKADSEADTVVVSTLNSPPVADAGPDQTRYVTETATLNGGGSSDVDGDALTYRWSFVSRPDGSAAVLSDPAAVSPTFVVDTPGDYVAQLIVNDGTVDSTPDTVVVSTLNSPPVADAGPDQAAPVTGVVTLDGSASSDVDGDRLTYRWSATSFPEGVADPAALLDDPAGVQPSFTIAVPGTYVFQLVVNDGTVDSEPDTVRVNTLNTAPVADAGPDQAGYLRDTVTLDGTGSSDVDGDALAYRWSFVTVPEAVRKAVPPLDGGDTATPSFSLEVFGTYVLQLVVNDGTVDSAPDTVQVTTLNNPPVADAGPDREVRVTDPVVLDGTASVDPDEDVLVYKWSVLSLPDTVDPAAGDTLLDDPGSPTPSFVAPAPGQYVFQLITSDGIEDSAPDTIVVRVTNAGPVIVLLGESTPTVECGAVYADAGAIVTDPEHGDITDRLEVTGTVDMATPGIYVLTFAADDPFGATADPVARTVTVADTTPPVVTVGGLPGGAMTVECGTEYVLPEASAADTCDVAELPVTRDEGGLDGHAPGTYTVTYSATDAFGNTGSATVTVEVVDTTPPEITLLGANPAVVECSAGYADAGAVATDMCAGDLGNADLDGSAVDPSTPGAYTVFFSATDNAGNTATASRTVIVRDTTAPAMQFIGPAVQTVECGAPYEEPGVTVSDNCDPDPVVEAYADDADTSAPGSFLVVYTARDAAGNSNSLTRTVQVADTLPPVITPYAPGPLTVTCGEDLADPGAWAADQCGGDTPVEADYTDVDLSKRGVYTITYTARDAAGNEAQATRAVTVEGICPEEAGSLCPEGAYPTGRLILEANFESDADGFVLDNDAGAGNGLWGWSDGCHGPNGIDGTAGMLYFGDTGLCSYDSGLPTGGLAFSPTLRLPGGTGSATLVFDYLLATEGAAGEQRDYAAVLVYTVEDGYVTLADNSAGVLGPVFKADRLDLCDDSTGPPGPFFKQPIPPVTFDWDTAVLDLSEFRGRDVTLVFLFDSYDAVYNAYPGFAVDHVQVYATDEESP